MLLCPEYLRPVHDSGKAASTNKTQQKHVTCYFPHYLVLLVFPEEALRATRVPFLAGTTQDIPEHMWLQRNLQCRPSSPPALFLFVVPLTVSLLLFSVDLFVLGPPPPHPQLQEAVHTLEHLGLTWQENVTAGSFQNVTPVKI